MGVFDPRPSFRGVTGTERMATAMDMPFSFGQAFGENFSQGITDSFGLGTAIRELGTPSLLSDRPFRGETPENYEARRGRFETQSLSEDEYKTSPFFREAVPYQPGMTPDRAAALAKSADTRAVRQYFSQKQPVAAFLGQFGGQALDPINYVPVFGQGAQLAAVARFGSIGGRALMSASEAAINTAAFGILTAGVRAKLGDDVSFEMIGTEIAMSALIGGAFGGGIGMLVRGRDARERVALGQARNALSTAANRQKAAIALNEQIDALATTGNPAATPNGMASIETVHTEVQRRVTAARSLDEQTAGVTGTKAGEVVIAPSGRRVSVAPEVVELDSLIHAEGALQVRNRRTAASDAQIEEIGATLDPARMMPNIDGSQGAPLVGADHIIDSGNGRVAGMRRAYEAYPEKAEAYRAFLAEQGYNVEGMQRPVLISRRMTDLDETARAQFNAELNGRTTASLGAVEIAQMDRAAMTDNVLDAHAPAPVTAASNRAFVQRFMAQLPANDRQALLSADGKALSAEGVRRIENALFASAYGDIDPSAVRRFAEGVDDNTRSIVGAMSDMAGAWAKMRRDAKAGVIPQHLDQTQELTDALRLIGMWREQAAREGRPVSKVISEGMAQMDLLTGEIRPETQVFIRSFYTSDACTTAHGREALAGQFADLIESGYELGRPSLFGDAMPEVSALQVLENAVRRNAETDPRPTGDALSRAEENGSADIEPAPGADRGLDRQSDEAGAEALAEADIFSHGADLGERPMSSADITDTMRERFENAGRPADEAEAAAGMLSTFYSTMAARTGRSLNDLLKIAPLPEVRRGTDLSAQALAQHGLDIYREVGGRRVQFDDEVQAQVYDLGTKLMDLNGVTAGQVLDGNFGPNGRNAIGEHMPEVQRLLDDIGPYIDADSDPVDNPGAMARSAMDLAAAVQDSRGDRAPPLIYADQQRDWNQRIMAGLRAEAEAALAKGEKPRRAAEMQLQLFQTEQAARAASTDTPEFREWFGDSKVVDAEGKPLVVYRGMTQEADGGAYTIRRGGTYGDGIYLAKNRADAAFWANPDEGPNPGVVEAVYVSLKNPAPQAVAERAEATATAERRSSIDILRNEGYDGIVADDGEIVAFDPTQIKSVNNRGTFDPNDPRILYQPAWHGTPHIFDKFEWSDKTRGKGEGAQAFGDGLYFAGKKQVAEHYRNVLSGGQVAMPSGARLRLNTLGEMEEFGEKLIAEIETLGLADERFPDGTARALLSTRPSSLIVDAFNSVDTNAQGDSIIAAARNWLAEKQQTEPDRLERTYVPAADARAAGKAYGTAIKLLDELEAKGLKVESGRLYKVDIPGDDELMLWDAPMSEQPAGVIEKLLPFAEQLSEGRADVKAIWEKRIRGEKVMGFGQMTGDEFYRLLSRARIKQEPDQPPGWGQISAGGDSDFRGDAAASAALREAGIPGHRFLDGGSRGSGEGSYNYVIYDDSRVSITEFEQGARGSIEFGSDGRSVMSMFDAADASTALHESAHWFLQMFRSFADRADAPAEIRADWDRVRAWWTENADAVAADSPTGATGDDVRRLMETGTSGNRLVDIGIEVGMQEQWARGFEAYLREGVAPNEGLRGIFDQFKRWLTSIYRQALDLNVNINDDIRGVFDRLLAQQQGDLVPNSTAPKPDPVPDGLDAAAAAVRTPADPLKLGAQYGLDDAGGFAEQADIDALKASDMLTPEDQAMLDEADQLVADAEAYGKTLETAAWCMR